MRELTPEDQFWSDVQHIVVDYTNRKHSLWPNPMGREIHKRKNALLYRWSAIWWHIKLTENEIAAAQKKINERDNWGKEPALVLPRLFSTGFLFDDVIFHLVSFFDYLAGLLEPILSGNRDSWQKWNGLLQSLKDTDYGRLDACQLLQTVHKEWVSKVAGYRAGIYHVKTDVGGAQYQRDYETGEAILHFFVPDGAMRNIPQFRGRERIELVAGMKEFAEVSGQYQRQILKAFFGEGGAS